MLCLNVNADVLVQAKVFASIVAPQFIYMVNNLSFLQRTAQHFLHDDPVFELFSSIRQGDDDISFPMGRSILESLFITVHTSPCGVPLHPVLMDSPERFFAIDTECLEFSHSFFSSMRLPHYNL